MLGQLTGEHGKPVKILKGQVFRSLEEAERAVFHRRWKKYTGNDLPQGATRGREGMKVTGYSDKLSAAPGEIVRFMVHCQLPTYRADIVCLICGDTNPQGPGVKERGSKNLGQQNLPGTPANDRNWFIRNDSTLSTLRDPGQFFLSGDDLADNPWKREAGDHVQMA